MILVMMEKKMETTIVYGALYRDTQKENGNSIVYWGCMGIREKKMETTNGLPRM